MSIINTPTKDITTTSVPKNRYKASVKTMSSGDVSIHLPVSTFTLKEIAEIPLSESGKNRTVIYSKEDIGNGLTVQLTVWKKEEFFQHEIAEAKRATEFAKREAEKLEAEQTKAKLEMLMNNPEIQALLAKQGF
jgi:hypothetical protein